MENHQIPHSLEGLHNGIYQDQFDHVYNDPANNGFGSNWGYNAADDQVSSAGHSMPLYSQWQATSASDHTMNAYARPISENRSFPQQSPYADYGDSRQYQQESYNPTLVSQSPNDHHFGVAHSPFSQPSQATATIAPRILENDTIRPVSEAKPLDTAVSSCHALSQHIPNIV